MTRTSLTSAASIKRGKETKGSDEITCPAEHGAHGFVSIRTRRSMEYGDVAVSMRIGKYPQPVAETPVNTSAQL